MSDLTKPLIAGCDPSEAAPEKEKKVIASLGDLFPLVLDHMRTSGFTEFKMTESLSSMKAFGDRVVVGNQQGELTLYSSEGAVALKTEPVVNCSLRDQVLILCMVDGRVVQWNLSENREIDSAQAHHSIRDAVFVPGTEQILTCGDEDIKLWGLNPLTELYCFEGHTRAVTGVDITLDGRYILSRAGAKECISWNLIERKQAAKINTSMEEIWTLALTPDSKRVALGGPNGNVYVWSLEDTTELAVFSEYKDRVRGLAVTPNNKKLIACGDQKFLTVWSLNDYKIIGELQKHDWGVWKVVAINDQFCASASGDNTVRIWDLNTLSMYATLLGHTNAVNYLHVSPKEDFLFTYSTDNTIRLWKLDIKKEALKAHEKRVGFIAISPRNNLLASGAYDGRIKLWDLASMSEITTLRRHAYIMASGIISANENYLIAGAGNGEVLVWSLDSRKEVATLKEQDKIISSIIETPDRKTFISASYDNTIKLWSYETWKSIGALTGAVEALEKIAVTTTGSHLIGVGYDNNTHIWNLQTLQHVAKFSHHAMTVCIAVTPDYFAVGDNQKFVILRSASDFSEIAALAGLGNTVLSVAIAARRKKCIAGDNDGYLIIWDLVRMEQELHIRAHTNSIHQIILFPNEDFFATVSKDTTVKVWSIDSLREVMKFEGHTEEILKGMLNPDCRHIISASMGGIIRIHDVSALIERKEESLQVLTENYEKVSGNYLLGYYMDNLIKGKVSKMTIMKRSIEPYNFNVLHIFAYFNFIEALTANLNDGVPILRGAFGSPLSVAIWRNTRKCIDTILSVLNKTLDQGTDWLAIQMIVDDIPDLLRRKSPHIRKFIQGVFRTRDELSQQILPLSSLPIILYLPNWKIDLRFFAEFEGNHPVQQGSEVVSFQVSEFKWNFTAGSKSSLEFLNACKDTEDTELLTTPLVRTVIDSKWKVLWPITFVHAFIYAVMLVVLVGIIFYSEYDPELYIAFIVLNVLFLLYELLQGLSTGIEYWGDPWNYLDIVRGTLAIIWVYFGFQELELYVIAFCFFRGFTFFRTFKMTRMFVRMTLEVVKEMYSFLIILAYSTLSFGMLYASIFPDQIGSPGDAWKTAYRLLMGDSSSDNFGLVEWVCFTAATLINIIIMLNLLVSILGDAYGKAQESAAVNDTLEQLTLILEYESLMFWRRSQGTPQVLVSCYDEDEFEEEDVKTHIDVRMDELQSLIEATFAKLEGMMQKSEKIATPSPDH